MKSGTLADRIASLTLSTRRSPRSRIEGLVTLQSMLKKKSRRESLMALDALSALYKSDLLPSDRKLIALEKVRRDVLNREAASTLIPPSDLQQPRDKLQSLAKAQREELMLQWYLEDAIKIQYSDFLLELEALLKDQMETTRLKALGEPSKYLLSHRLLRFNVVSFSFDVMKRAYYMVFSMSDK